MSKVYLNVRSMNKNKISREKMLRKNLSEKRFIYSCRSGYKYVSSVVAADVSTNRAEPKNS